MVSRIVAKASARGRGPGDGRRVLKAPDDLLDVQSAQQPGPTRTPHQHRGSHTLVDEQAGDLEADDTRRQPGTGTRSLPRCSHTPHR